MLAATLPTQDVLDLLLAPFTVMASITVAVVGVHAVAGWWLARSATPAARERRMAAEINYGIALGFGVSIVPSAVTFGFAVDSLL